VLKEQLQQLQRIDWAALALMRLGICTARHWFLLLLFFSSAVALAGVGGDAIVAHVHGHCRGHRVAATF